MPRFYTALVRVARDRTRSTECSGEDLVRNQPAGPRARLRQRKNILLLSMGLLLAFWYAAATTYILWWHLRAMRRIYGKPASPPTASRDQERG